MRSPLIAGTLIHNRYSIIQLLGQGGFARTYLAQDQGRFNELCVLKELIPTQNSRMAVEKARELFEREATILYQVRHPQIPQFRASFEYDGAEGPRLFLVQDYVAGKTYRQLLSDRKSKGEVFSEADVRSLLVQILPVLDYLHTQGIIHRDISPENLILRQSDRLPVLIDFGVVKEMVTRWQEANGPYPATTVGKLGFSPMEQLQTGRVYPSSDLYSLAVTVVVLLTGQEPQELFEDRTATWHWHRWAAISPELAKILDRMLLYRPGDRFGSASEVLIAMQFLPAPMAPAIAQPGALRSQFAEGATMGWESSVMLVPPTLPSESHLPIPKGVRSYPWRVMGLGATLTSLIAATSLLTLVFSGRLSLTNQARNLQTSDQSIQGTRTNPNRQVFPSFPFPANLTSFPQPKLKRYTQALMLSAPEQTTVSSTLEQNQVIDYQLLAEKGQSLKLTLTDSPGVAMTIQRSDGATLDGPKPGSTQSLDLITGQYILRLKLKPGAREQAYLLGIALYPPPIAASSSSLGKSSGTAVSLPAGNIRKFSGWVNPGRPKRYLVRGQAGQVLTAVIVDGSVTLNLRSPSGKPIKNAYGLGDWKGKLTTTGNYQIEVMAFSPTAYKLNLSLRNPR